MNTLITTFIIDMVKTSKVTKLLLFINCSRFSSSMNSPFLARNTKMTPTMNCKSNDMHINTRTNVSIRLKSDTLLFESRSCFNCEKFVAINAFL